MFLVTKQGMESLLEIVVRDFLIQLMTGAIDLDTVIKVYDHRDAREDCVIVLHELEPVMLRDAEARSFREWYQAQLAGTGRIPASSPARPSVLNSTPAA